MERVIRLIVRHRLAIGALLLISLGAATWSALRLEVRFQFRDFFDYPGNPDVAVLDRYSAEFGDPAGFVVILVEGEDVFRRDVLDYLQAVTHDLEPIDIYSHVHSLTNANVMYGKGDDVVAGALMPVLPSTPAATEEVRRVATRSTLLVRRLVSADSRATVVMAEMRVPAVQASIHQQREAIATARAVLARHAPPSGVRVRVTGAPVAEVESTGTLFHDLGVLTPAATLLILAALWLTFRSLAGIVLPLAAVVVAMVWTAGIFAAMHHPVDIVGSTMPATLLVYGVVDPIFVLTRYMQKLEAGLARTDAIVAAQRELALPCFLTSLTTTLGFFSFATATLPTVAKYGLTVGTGVFLSWVTTVVVLPILLSLIPPPRARADRLGPWLDRRITGLWSALRGRVRPAIAAAFVLLLLGAAVGWKQRISSVYVANLPDGEALDAIHVLERKLSGVDRTLVYFEGEPGSMKRPEVLRAIAAVDAFAEAQSTVNTSISLADLVAEANQAFHGGDAAEHRVPNSQPLIAQYLSLFDPADRSDFVDASYAHSHLRILSEDRGSEVFRSLKRELQRVCDEQFKGLNVKTSITGHTMVGYTALDQVVIEMLIGFIIAFAIIVLFELLLFRSLGIALISVVTNLVPVAASFVYLRVFDISLRIDTALFLSVSIGGLFNTTIHFAARVRQLVSASGEHDPDEIILQAMRSIGPPALFTAAILSLGFASFTLSGFAGLLALGMVSMITLTVGFFSDMIVTAVLMRAFYDWKGARRDVG
jgi:predicted RND superfamily exporter protein